jgi:anti-anti-sigma regulatory factor
MAFQIFKRAAGDVAGQTPAKKGPETPGNRTEAGQSPNHDFAPSASQTGIDVEDNADALPQGLQTAALLFANKQTQPALEALRHAVTHEEKKHSGSWLALLDLLRRAGDRTLFDDYALKFVVEFERSAPSWDELSTDSTASSTNAQHAASAVLPNALVGEKPIALASLSVQTKKPRVGEARLAIDAREMVEIDTQAVDAFSELLVSARRKNWPIEWTGLEQLSERIWKPLRAGEAKMMGRWKLGLEALIWRGREKEFDDRAVDYAVTFELSPPSWEQLTPEQAKWAGASTKPTLGGQLSLEPLDSPTEIGASAQKINWSGSMSGPNDVQLKRLLEPTQRTERLELDMKLVKHVDFVCAGAIGNGILRVMASGRRVNIFGASPILKALLQITGVPENLFVRARKA